MVVIIAGRKPVDGPRRYLAKGAMERVTATVIAAATPREGILLFNTSEDFFFDSVRCVTPESWRENPFYFGATSCSMVIWNPNLLGCCRSLGYRHPTLCSKACCLRLHSDDVLPDEELDGGALQLARTQLAGFPRHRRAGASIVSLVEPTPGPMNLQPRPS